MHPANSTTTATYPAVTPVAVRKAHPIRGILWGLPLGIGAAAMAIILKLVPFEQLWAYLIIGAGIVLGVLWSIFGPAKKPKGPPPQRIERPVVPPADTATAGPATAGPATAAPATAAAVTATALAASTDDDLRIEPLDIEPLELGHEPVADVVLEPAPSTPESPQQPVPGPAPDAMPDAMPEPADGATGDAPPAPPTDAPPVPPADAPPADAPPPPPAATPQPPEPPVTLDPPERTDPPPPPPPPPS